MRLSCGRSLILALAVTVPAAPAGAATLPPSGTLDLFEAPLTTAVTWTGSEVGGLAGGALAGLGDFDGDGRPDLAVGEPKRDTAAGVDAGAVHIVLSPATGGALDDGTRTITITGLAAGSQLGFSVAAAGDVDGDGLADLLVGAPASSATTADGTPAAGAAYLVLGRRDRGPIDLAGDFGGRRITGAAPDDQLGRSVASVPDQNGDRLPELLVGAPTRDGVTGDRKDAGSAYVIYGGTGDVDVSTLTETKGGWRIDGPVGVGAAGAFAGRALGAIGDLNGDGRAEVLVTAPRAATGLSAEATAARGIAYVIFGRSEPGVVDLETLGGAGFPITGPVTATAGGGDWLGESITGLGDVNDDGRPDLVVGAHLADAPNRGNAGIVYVVFGKGDAKPVDLDRLGGGGYRITGVDEQDQTGFDTAAVGDVNADGLTDFAITGPFADPASRPESGASYVVFGRRGTPTDLDLAELGDRALRIGGASAGDTSGFAVTGLGDVDGDGGADLAVGSTAIDRDYLFSRRSDKAGAVAVVFGASPAQAQQSATAAITTDPGYVEELERGCRIATNVQVLMEDNSYTDERADTARIRLTGTQAYVADPRNAGTVLGVTGFASGGQDGGAEPIFPPTVLAASRSADLNARLREAVDGADSFPGYPFMVRTFANDNPGAQARILLVDGVLFRDMDEFDGLTEGNPPTYVLAVGRPPNRSRADITEMRRLAVETKGRYYEARTPRGIERAFHDIESRLRCDLETEDFVELIEPGEPDEFVEEEIEDDAYTADVELTWRDPKTGFDVESIDVVRGGNVVRRIGPRAIQRAYAIAGAKARTAPVTGGRGRTFRALHLRGLDAGGTLRVRVRARSGTRGGRVYVRVTQSRRRR